MITLGSALFVDSASVRENLIHILGGGITQFLRPDFPAPLVSDFALTLYSDGTDTGNHEFSVSCYQDGGDTEPGFVFDGELNIGAVESDTGDVAQSVPMIIPLGTMGVPAPGRYRLVVRVDGAVLTTVPFVAVLVAAQ